VVFGVGIIQYFVVLVVLVFCVLRGVCGFGQFWCNVVVFVMFLGCVVGI